MIITLSSYEREGFVKIRNDRHYQFTLEECIKEETWPSVITEIYSLMETYEYSLGYSTSVYTVKKSLIFFNEDKLVYTVNIEIPDDDQGFILGGYLKDTILDSILSGRIKE